MSIKYNRHELPTLTKFPIIQQIYFTSILYNKYGYNSRVILLKNLEVIMDYLVEYLIIINLVTSLVFAVDKKRAQKGRWRIPEAWLFGLSLIGGSLGGLLSMKVMRHKTKKMSFVIGMPLLLIANLFLVYYLVRFF